MSGIEITETGAREIGARLENFTPSLHARLTERIEAATAELWESVEEVVPHLTGRLASEIASRLFSGARNRVAGYVSVYAPNPGPHNEYAKAATLEYGSNKPRAVRDETHGIITRLAGSSRRIRARMSSPVNLAARRYLRGPLEELRGPIMVSLEEAVDETVAEANAG